LPGCVGDSMRAAKPPVVCAHHDLARPIGKIVGYEDGDKALDITVRMADLDAVPDARTAFSLITDGVCDGWSIGFSRKTWDAVPKEQRSDYGTNEAKEFMRAVNLREVSLVALPAVDGTGVLAIRAEETPTLVVITVEDIERQFKGDLLDRHEARALLATLSPAYRETIVLGVAGAGSVVESPGVEEVAVTSDHNQAAISAAGPEGRADPTMAASSTDTSDDGDDDDAASLAAATDAALDSAVYWFSKVDLSGLPDEVQQGIALCQAAGVAVDELLDVMGVDDPDDDMGDASGRAAEAPESAGAPEVASDSSDAAAEAREDTETETVETADPETEERALTLSTKPWSDFSEADYTPAQYKAACLIWDGPDTDKSSGSLPVKEPGGTVNKAALSAAAGRLGQVKASPADKTAAAKALLSLYASAKMTAPGSLLAAARSVEDPEVRDMAVELELDGLDDIFSRHGVTVGNGSEAA
jgi:HK97 family phage prohead protease